MKRSVSVEPGIGPAARWRKGIQRWEGLRQMRWCGSGGLAHGHTQQAETVCPLGCSQLPVPHGKGEWMRSCGPSGKGRPTSEPSLMPRLITLCLALCSPARATRLSVRRALGRAQRGLCRSRILLPNCPGIAAFGNAGCRYDDIRMFHSRARSRQGQRDRRQERQNGCRE
jgi:hypothetical protein